MSKKSDKENASEQVRVYPSDFEFINEEADKRVTIAAQIVHEALDLFRAGLLKDI